MKLELYIPGPVEAEVAGVTGVTGNGEEIICKVLSGDLYEISACNMLGWNSEVKVGGFCNLHDAPTRIQAAINSLPTAVVAWPEGLSMSTDEEAPGHADAVKAFRKAASKLAKKMKKTEALVATPFSKMAYTPPGKALVEAGFYQLHMSVEIEGVKIGVHYWGNAQGRALFHKLKIDKEEQLALFL